MTARMITAEKPPVYYDRAFSGHGVNVYLSKQLPVVYRNPRVIQGLIVRGKTGPAFTDWTASNRVAQVEFPGNSLTLAIPPELIPTAGETSRLFVDVRTYKADVENSNDNYRVQSIEIDDQGELLPFLSGTAQLLSVELRTGGVARLLFAYISSNLGELPARLTLVCTSGPTAVEDLVIPVFAGQRQYQFDTPPLDDSAPYFFTLQAENLAGDVVVDLLTDIGVQADQAGPPAVNLISVEVV